MLFRSIQSLTPAFLLVGGIYAIYKLTQNTVYATQMPTQILTTPTTTVSVPLISEVPITAISPEPGNLDNIYTGVNTILNLTPAIQDNSQITPISLTPTPSFTSMQIAG